MTCLELVIIILVSALSLMGVIYVSISKIAMEQRRNYDYETDKMGKWFKNLPETLCMAIKAIFEATKNQPIVGNKKENDLKF